MSDKTIIDQIVRQQVAIEKHQDFLDALYTFSREDLERSNPTLIETLKLPLDSSDMFEKAYAYLPDGLKDTDFCRLEDMSLRMKQLYGQGLRNYLLTDKEKSELNIPCSIFDQYLNNNPVAKEFIKCLVGFHLPNNIISEEFKEIFGDDFIQYCEQNNHKPIVINHISLHYYINRNPDIYEDLYIEDNPLSKNSLQPQFYPHQLKFLRNIFYKFTVELQAYSTIEEWVSTQSNDYPIMARALNYFTFINPFYSGNKIFEGAQDTYRLLQAAQYISRRYWISAGYIEENDEILTPQRYVEMISTIQEIISMPGEDGVTIAEQIIADGHGVFVKRNVFEKIKYELKNSGFNLKFLYKRDNGFGNFLKNIFNSYEFNISSLQLPNGEIRYVVSSEALDTYIKLKNKLGLNEP